MQALVQHQNTKATIIQQPLVQVQKFDSVDQIVLKQLEGVDSETYDKSILMAIYNNFFNVEYEYEKRNINKIMEVYVYLMYSVLY